MIIYLLVAFGAAALLLRQIFTVVQYFRSELRSVPGPIIARLTSGWYAWQVWQGSFQDVNRDLHQRYGSVVRYAPGRYSFSDLDAVKAIYGLL
ncbi:cytochrome p450 oxidoreductase [Fusarium langsethiae]|uniref:Cytochrome p450 oxidoreductase n=1 Tax=Fusarium langsethiae TaxID=179993 RepID=A0A0M9EQN3_FUSLA|nr:cytochrome p450 oxidoreductase [Fusarium langsethiae]GKU10448.1 unnamed protein product [Fusarium langsethiae]